MSINANKIDLILELIGFYRKLILDLVEQEITEQKSWDYVRSRLLCALGDRGLEGKIKFLLQDTAIVSNPHQNPGNRQ